MTRTATLPKPSALAEAEREYIRERFENSTATWAEVHHEVDRLANIGRQIRVLARSVGLTALALNGRCEPQKIIARMVESVDDQFGGPAGFSVVLAAAMQAVEG